MACLNSCIHNAIGIFTDECGFKYPFIISDLCINCNLCKQICPNHHQQYKKEPLYCYAVTIKGQDILSCASGGAATAVSRYVLEKGGVVFGCSGIDIFHVMHIRVTNVEDLHSLKGSKYVQSDVGLIYRSVKDDLNRNVLVLFIGTPCQVSGLKGYLRKDYQNLITADIVCHGVPSQKLLSDNVRYYQKKFKNKIVINSIHFREKVGNATTNSLQIIYGFFFQFRNLKYQNIKKENLEDQYVKGFIKGLFLRNNCYKCSYACPERIGDLTFADFWGIGCDTTLKINNGVSLVLLNSEKVLPIFDEIVDKANIETRTIKEAIAGNGRLQSPICFNLKCKLFHKLYPILGLRLSVDICLIKDRMRDKVRTLLRRTNK